MVYFQLSHIVVNIEIDGPHHKQPKTLHYTRLRDEYFRQHHGISIRRVDASSSSSAAAASMRRDGSKKHVVEILMGILKGRRSLSDWWTSAAAFLTLNSYMSQQYAYIFILTCLSMYFIVHLSIHCTMHTVSCTMQSIITISDRFHDRRTLQ